MSVIETILEGFPLSRAELLYLIRTAPSRYKVHEIEKRNGRGKRTIAQPTAEIKLLQKFLLKKYIDKLPVNDAAKAYRAGRGIIDHASAHAGNRYLLKMDFKDFFPSLMAVDFIKHLHKYSDLSSVDARYLSRIFFWRPKGERALRLSIGAPSSPAISNALMLDFDTKLQDYCDKCGIKYTRYADDLALSTSQPNILFDAQKFVASMCHNTRHPKLVINDEKTVFTSKKHHRQLTGLTLSNDGRASLGRDRKREIRAMAHHYEQGRLSPEEISKLRGWIAFSISIDTAFVQTIEKLIGDEAFKKLMRG